MPINRFENSRGNFIIGMLCLFTSLIFFCYSAYVLPFLVFGWRYNLPEFILNLVSTMRIDYHWNQFVSGCMIFLIFFIPGLILMLIANVISNRLEKELTPQITDENLPIEASEKKPLSDGWKLTLKVFGMLVAVFLFLRLIEWVISK